PGQHVRARDAGGARPAAGREGPLDGARWGKQMGKKKVRAVLKIELPAGRATPAPPVGTALGPHGVNIMEFTRSYNERTAQQAGGCGPRRDHDLRGQKLHLRSEDTAGREPSEEGRRPREGLGPCAAGEGRKRDPRSGQGNRRDEGQGPQRVRGREGDEDDRGHGTFDGARSRWLSAARST